MMADFIEISGAEVHLFLGARAENLYSWAKTNKFMGEGEFDNLMGERILKKTLPVGESLPKISLWTSSFLSSCELTTQFGRAELLRCSEFS